MEPSEHLGRVDAVVTAAPDVLAEWADEILRPANFLRFSERLDELLERAGDIGTEVLDASPEFVRRIVKTRNFLTHQDDDKDVLGDNARHWHGEALRWINTAVLMLELGFDATRVAQLVRRNLSYSPQMNRLRESAADYSS